MIEWWIYEEKCPEWNIAMFKRITEMVLPINSWSLWWIYEEKCPEWNIAMFKRITEMVLPINSWSLW